MSNETNVVALVPFEHRAIGPDDVAVLIGCKPRTVLQVYACRPDFPKRIQRKPARWSRLRRSR